MPDWTATLTDEPEPAARDVILRGLIGHNHAHAGPSGSRPLCMLIRDGAGETIGGLWGSTGYGWLFTELLFVPEGLRGQGVGTRLLTEAEGEARRRGCANAWLDTFEFQARRFYEGLGYTVFGELPGYPAGFSRYFLKKTL